MQWDYRSSCLFPKTRSAAVRLTYTSPLQGKLTKLRAPQQCGVPTTATQTQDGGIRSPRPLCRTDSFPFTYGAVSLLASLYRNRGEKGFPCLCNGWKREHFFTAATVASHPLLHLAEEDPDATNNPWAGDHHYDSSIPASLAHPHALPKHLGLLATAQLDTSPGRLLRSFMAGLRKWFKEG